ncbi:hypothetical protein MPSEU_000670300 [Mayamaea pseudoterrestris]|nr:hypothetical protein MPSEU_000670300 [Mayamaea pseudoterrestris]
MLEQVARRLSLRSDTDGNNNDSSPPPSPLSEKSCIKDLDKYYPNIPSECQHVTEVKQALQRKNSNKHSQAIAFAGMHPHEATHAMAAREQNALHHAQITRRLTTTKKRSLW